uniref:Uncharacterized protein n=1 Tax=Brassica campestris TaxID=3711 RepID=M4F7A7_BRACM
MRMKPCDAPLGSAPGKTDMHGLIMGRNKDICSSFDLYLPNHEVYMHEITCRRFSTQLRSSSKKNKIKQSSYVIVMPFTNQVIFSSREFRPPEKLEMANLLSHEPTTNSIMLKVIIHVLDVQESFGLMVFKKIQKQTFSGQMEKPIKCWLREKMDFDQASKGHVLAHIRSIFFTFQSHGRGYIKRQSKFQSKTLFTQCIGANQHGDQDVMNNLTKVRSSERTDQTDRAFPRASGLELRLEPRPDDRTDRTTARLPRQPRHSKTHARAILTLGREGTEDRHAFLSGGPSEQSRQRPYLYPVHPSGSDEPEHYLKGHF